MKAVMLIVGLFAFCSLPTLLHAQIGHDDLILTLTNGDSSTNGYGGRSFEALPCRSITSQEKASQTISLMAPTSTNSSRLGIVTPSGKTSFLDVNSSVIVVAINAVMQGEYYFFFADANAIVKMAVCVD